MNAKLTLPFFCVLLLVICSCRMPSEDFSSDPTKNVVQDGLPKPFWAYNYKTSQYYIVTADLVVDGTYCRIWVEQGSGVDVETANKVALTFDSEIYPRMMDTFAIYGDMTSNGEIIATNTMELADWLGDGDGKLAILLLDIKDNYVKGVNESRTAGYFSSSDLIANRRHSNNSDILYIDTNPEWPGTEESNKTIAHEMQHLMNFVTGTLFRTERTVREMDTWINEGLSAIAEWIYSGKHSEERWVHYNADPSGLIQKGNNFYTWGNRINEHKYAELDDYATVYLFFHWLRVQTGSNSIFSDLIKSNEYSYLAVTQAAKNSMGGSYDDWETLLKSWLAANYINASTGPYGYMNDRILRNIKAKTLSSTRQSVQLYPGEAVYSITNAGFPWPNEKNNIKYAGLTDISPWMSNSETFAGGALLTYNANKNEQGGSEEGITTGVYSNIDATLYERRIRALLSQRIVSSTSRTPGHVETPGPAMTGAVTVPVLEIIKLE